MAAVIVYAVALFSDQPHDRWPLGYLILAVVCVALLVRRQAPEVPLLILVIARWWQVSHPPGEAYVALGLFVCVFTVAATRPRRWTAIVWVFVTLVVLFAVPDPGWPTPGFAASVGGYFGLAAACGLSVRRERSIGDEIGEEAQIVARLAAEQEASAVERERGRLRDDLHDIVGHHLNLALVLAQSARLAVDREDRRLVKSLRDIESTTRSALEEMDRATRWASAGNEVAPTPTPTLASYASLVAPLERAGFAVEVTAPSPEDLARVDLVASATAHRALQEMLTNVLKHSASRWAKASISLTRDLVVVAVVSGEPAERAPSARLGTGLDSMRRRVELLGGRLEVGCDSDEFRQELLIPWSMQTLP